MDKRTDGGSVVSVIWFGTGEMTRILLSCVDRAKLVIHAFIDERPHMRGTNYAGSPVRDFASIPGSSFDYILIACGLSEVIADRLIKAGVPSGKIISLNFKAVLKATSSISEPGEAKSTITEYLARFPGMEECFDVSTILHTSWMGGGNNNLQASDDKRRRMITPEQFHVDIALLATFVYKNLIKCLESGSSLDLWNELRKCILRYCDPEISVFVDGISLDMNLSHKFPICYTKYKKSDRLLPELCSALKNTENKMKLIDIGANIGDTAALVDKNASGDILCVEGTSEFLPLLHINTGRLKNCRVQIADVFCSDENKTTSCYKKELSTDGTAKLIRTDAEEQEAILASLDKLTEDFSYFRDANILKIDTDGFEIPVIRGGIKFLTNAKPIIFFEFFPSDFINFSKNESAEEAIFPVLHNIGYKKALFYDNYGNLRNIIEDISYTQEIKRIIKRIDSRNIYYYDVLTVHKDNKIHNTIFDNLSCELYKN
jgi:FkbM family methyltransferase